MALKDVGVTPGKLWVAAIGIGAVACFIYPIPQIREAERQRVVAEERAREERRLAEQRQIEEANEKAILTADRATIERAVDGCKKAILKLLTENSPFDVYFPHYAPEELRKFAGIGSAFSAALGSPSVALDNYDFDPVSWNVDRIMHKDYPVRSIAFVVESASDGFSVTRYAAVYSCRMEGLKISEPYRDFKVNID